MKEVYNGCKSIIEEM